MKIKKIVVTDKYEYMYITKTLTEVEKSIKFNISLNKDEQNVLSEKLLNIRDSFAIE